MSKPTSIFELISLWPSRADLAHDMIVAAPDRPVSKYQVDKWARTQMIPAKYHKQLLTAAEAREFPVSANLIIDLHALQGQAA